MPAADLATGFYGKIPATGDFVGRGLTGEFVRTWDRWVAVHLAPLQSSGAWTDEVALRFLLGPEANGPMAGIVVTSSDKAGRCFPLTVASPLSAAFTGLGGSAAKWFDGIELAADAARYGNVGAEDFANELATLPFPPLEASGEPVIGMVFWTDASAPMEVEWARPQPALDQLLAARLETS